MKQLSPKFCFCRSEKKWQGAPSLKAKKGLPITVASTLYPALLTEENAGRFIADFIGTTGVRNPLFGDAWVDWIKIKNAMHEPLMKKI